MFNEEWSATLTYSFQRQSTLGAWDEDPTCRRGRSSASVPRATFEAKMVDFHVDGDVGIGDLVFASTYWSLPTRQQNEYSQYKQNFNAGASMPVRTEGFTCLNDPYYGTGPYTGCNGRSVLLLPHQSAALVE